MQRLFWIGSPFFSPSLTDCGWQVHFFNFGEVAVFSWNDLVRMAGWEPEVVVVADKSRPPFVLGMEDFPCLTVFYAVDTHIHSWYPLYAQGFDCCLVSLRDHVELFRGKRLSDKNLLWSPPYARETDGPDPDVAAQWDCLFVGTVDPETTPGRVRFLEKLKGMVPGLHVMHGNYRDLYSKGRVLLNYCEHGDLNFRVFEALGCGGCLVTPRLQHGMHELFVDGEHLVMYAPDDAVDAAAKIDFLLKDPELTAYIAETGKALIDEKHRAGHRAQAFTDFLCDLWMEGADALVANRRAKAAEIREKWLRIPYLLWAEQMQFPLLREAYLHAARGTFGQKS